MLSNLERGQIMQQRELTPCRTAGNWLPARKAVPALRLATLCLMMVCLAERRSEAAEAPSYALQVGYTSNTFSGTFNPSAIDLSNSKDAGYSWYLWNLFGSHTDPAKVIVNSDATVTLLGDSAMNGQLMTATPAKNSEGFVGTAFGGGAYIEATLKFNPADVSANSKSWPAFWSIPFETSMRPGANQWPGQAPGYVHHVEVDFFEYLIARAGGPQNAYGSSMHDWYGIYNKTCGPGLCQVGFEYNEGKRLAPSGTDFTQYHTYGTLWVSATPSKQGYIRFYFDGQPVGQDHKWTQYTNQPPTNIKQQPWAFGVLDQQHLVLILGTGSNQPMTVRSVNVWQASAAQNLHN
jgi:hypothetical protein